MAGLGQWWRIWLGGLWLAGALGCAAGSALAQGTGSRFPEISRELAELAQQTQDDRQGEFDGVAVGRRDAVRRQRVHQLIRGGLLETAEDYFHAAIVLQHGLEADEVMLAHALAMLAGYMGHPQARWLSAATLDRYLLLENKPQFFGTQYEQDSEGRWRPGQFHPLLTKRLRFEFRLPMLKLVPEPAEDGSPP